MLNVFCFLLDKRVDVTEDEPEEEWEEDLEEEPGRGRRGLRRGLRRGTRRRNKKRSIKQKVCLQLHYWRQFSHFLLIVHLLLIDGWRMEDGEDDNWEWEPEQEPSCGKQISMKQIYINNSTYIRDDKNDRFTQFLLLCFDDFHLFLVLFSDWKKTQKRTLKIQVKLILRNTQQGNNLDEQSKDKYETSVHN